MLDLVLSEADSTRRRKPRNLKVKGKKKHTKKQKTVPRQSNEKKYSFPHMGARRMGCPPEKKLGPFLTLYTQKN